MGPMWAKEVAILLALPQEELEVQMTEAGERVVVVVVIAVEWQGKVVQGLPQLSIKRFQHLWGLIQSNYPKFCPRNHWSRIVAEELISTACRTQSHPSRSLSSSPPTSFPPPPLRRHHNPTQYCNFYSWPWFFCASPCCVDLSIEPWRLHFLLPGPFALPFPRSFGH